MSYRDNQSDYSIKLKLASKQTNNSQHAHTHITKDTHKENK